MPTLSFAQFQQKIDGKMTGPKGNMAGSNCAIKREISNQFASPFFSDDQRSDAFEAAKKSAGISSDSEYDYFFSNLSRGSGSSVIAAALWYWLHLQPDRSDNALAIDRIALGGISFEQRFRIGVFIRDEITEYSSSAAGEDAHAESFPEDVDARFELLNAAWLANQEYPSIILLLKEIEQIFAKKDVHYGDRPDGLYTVRSVMDQREWIETEVFEKTYHDSQSMSDWVGPHGNFERWHDNRRFILVRDDTVSISTDALHEIELWFLKLDLLLRDGVLQPKNFDLFLRYVMVFACSNRSGFLKFYFVANKEKIHRVMENAVRRAAELGWDIRDFRNMDEPFKDIFDAS